ncbi:sugar lactone lactonase YvrE [Aquimarina sp. EL_43]|uniref:cadherin domain-containing protein n=1 Tax=unclassified Aquimarina TaxID=2627091 RepID=UPI0018C978FB|nr:MULTISPECIES: cadherin domain-containing protein [unclassified Aquimarina]MBG6129080.1 sugar lactone lactonase YvrE [Aquimarina sp. EL_35]MBG6150145.1 sugar lactone lactonase YvrE [Aquimarina sp. EL_32]MBG6167170.1 sugar lactone lactonase YvrE [Aquimarina sp. EL_43]
MKTIKLLLLCTAIILLSCSKDDDPAITPVNNAPEIKAQSFNASESAADTDVFGTVKATDADKEELSYSITANSDNLFEITKAGALSLVAGKTLDFETKTTHEITVEVTDGKAKAAAKITITVIDVDENMPPVIADQTFSVAENINTTDVIGTIVATDPDGDNLTYTLTNPDNPTTAFIIEDDKIKLSQGESLDFETTTSHVVTITASDGTLTASAQITINVTDVVETSTVTVSTFAGSFSGYVDATGTAARFALPSGCAIDSHGNLFVADVSNQRIRKITPAGVVTTFAGSTFGYADGTGTAAQFNAPYDIAIDANDNLYIADSNNNRIRKITPAGVVTTLAGSGISGSANGTGTAARFNGPRGVAVDASGNVYVSDYGNHRIRKVTPTGVVTNLAGGSPGFADGTGLNARFNHPSGLTVNSNGDIYVCDNANHRVRKITPAGVVATIVGNGTAGFLDNTGTSARFSYPRDITVDANDNLYVTDFGNRRVRKITPAKVVTTIAGNGSTGSTDGDGTVATFNSAYGIAFAGSGTFYVTDNGSSRIRKIVISNNH